MRIIGGELSGRKLQAPTGRETRPTTDRMRESLFNILEHRFHVDFTNLNILDLYAGTGALGIEALSRGAAQVSFIEINPVALKCLNANLKQLHLLPKTTIICHDATKSFITRLTGVFDIVFMDPPYGKGYGSKSLQALVNSGLLHNDSLMVMEEGSKTVIEPITGIKQIFNRTIGQSQLLFFERNGKTPAL